MRSLLKSIFRILPKGLQRIYHNYRDRKILMEWMADGAPAPPPHIVKQMALANYQKKFGIDHMVETGTFMGHMIDAQKGTFKKITSIELSQELWKNAVHKYRNDPEITILQGDSGKVLHELVPTLKKPAVFWLDGHYSEGVTARGDKDCPIYEELDAILPSKMPHVLVIDDARCFNGTGDYPTIKAITDHILEHRPESVVEVRDDLIRAILK